MKYNWNNLGFDAFFKITLLIFIAYFLILLTNISFQLSSKSEIGRYQFHMDKTYLLDTKTGVVKKYKISNN